ncbi:GerAB/ArcD/ProY family transporter [archaeon]|nr:GerAB/ArcD/ProY family transporter [archaeon]
MTSLKTFRATALLTGTVIGAGVLGIPYVVAKAGFLTGLLIIVALGLAMLMLHLFVGEVVLRTPGNHQLPGYAEKYLGKWGKRLMVFSLFFGIYGALIAYLIGEGQVLSAILGLTPSTFSIIFAIFSAIFVYRGLKTISKLEIYFLAIVLFFLLLLSGFAIFSGKFTTENLAGFSLVNLLIPYGVILFALHGAIAVPEMKEYLVKNKSKLKKAIILGSIIPLIAYILFTFATIGITGINTTELATIGLGNSLGESMILFGNLFAIFAMLTSFLTLALAMKETYIFDYKIKPLPAWALTMMIPIIIFLVGINSFIKVIGITGAFSVGLQGILIVLMFWKARKHGNRIPEYKLGKKFFIGLLLILIFILGIVYQFIDIF